MNDDLVYHDPEHGRVVFTPDPVTPDPWRHAYPDPSMNTNPPPSACTPDALRVVQQHYANLLESARGTHTLGGLVADLTDGTNFPKPLSSCERR